MLTNSHDSNFPSEVLGEGNKLEIPNISALSSIVPYLPSILLDTVSRNPNRPIPWIECLDGSLVLADVSGFTSMTEKLAQVGKEGAEWLTSIINDYFQRMLDTVSNYGGTNLRFGGDALLLLFRGDSHAVRAVAAASAMQRATRQFTTFHFGKYRVHLKMTVGVHSSSFYHAAVGLKEYPVQHLVLGSATNVVAKIQGLATTGELVISRETCDLIGDLCLTEPRSDGFVVLRLRKRPAGYHKGYPHVEAGGRDAYQQRTHV